MSKWLNHYLHWSHHITCWCRLHLACCATLHFACIELHDRNIALQILYDQPHIVVDNNELMTKWWGGVGHSNHTLIKLFADYCTTNDKRQNTRLFFWYFYSAQATNCALITEQCSAPSLLSCDVIVQHLVLLSDVIVQHQMYPLMLLIRIKCILWCYWSGSNVTYDVIVQRQMYPLMLLFSIKCILWFYWSGSNVTFELISFPQCSVLCISVDMFLK